MTQTIYALAGGLSYEFSDHANKVDTKQFISAINGQLTQTTTMLDIDSIELDSERQRVNAVMSYLTGQDPLRVSMSATDLEVWDYTWDKLLLKFDFEGTTIQVLNLAQVYARILVAVGLREQEWCSN